ALAIAARRTAADCAERIDMFSSHLEAVITGDESPLPCGPVGRVDGRQRWLITSDLHRCVPGRVDWPRRQRTKDLYADVLERYADDGWGLIENGDVEDFWMTSSNARDTAYDLARVLGAVTAPVDPTLEMEAMAAQLDRIVENNQRIYGVIRERFAEPGRYHRTVGNHDEHMADPILAKRLRRHLPKTEPLDSILLVDPGTRRDPMQVTDRSDVMAVVTHGHLTDSWNGPGYSALGRAITWLGLGLDQLAAPRSSESLPDEQAVGRLLSGRGRNRLVGLDPRFGGNRRFDSLDEERLFRTLSRDEPEDGWPWLLFGHTHYPMLCPLDRDGNQTRYANSGTGVLDGAISALEWEPDAGMAPKLVLWLDTSDGPTRKQLVADGATLQVV
ncbi:MAG: hypothetical protein ACR2OH_00155, partial [Microthrixaceae bacterium]